MIAVYTRSKYCTSYYITSLLVCSLVFSDLLFSSVPCTVYDMHKARIFRMAGSKLIGPMFIFHASTTISCLLSGASSAIISSVPGFFEFGE